MHTSTYDRTSLVHRVISRSLLNRVAVVIGLLVIAGALQPVAAQWQPAEVPLMSRWAEEVTPENAWTEYPRPQMERARWMNLNGLWDYAVAGRAAPQPTNYDGDILVPYPIESALSGVGRRLSPEERLWYRRTFEVPTGWDEERVLLHLGAVDWSSTVYVNGGLVGTHEGGFDPFTFDVTDFLTEDGLQELVVTVWDPGSEGEQPRGKQANYGGRIWYTPASGIWQTAWLEPVPADVAVAEVKATPNVDAGQVAIDVLTHRPTLSDAYAARVSVYDGSELVAQSEHRVNRRHTIALPDARLWSPDDPFLYGLKVEVYELTDAASRQELHRVPAGAPEEQAFFEVGEGSRLVDEVESYFGMREIEVGEGPHGHAVMLLNNEPVFQYGPLDQGYWPGGLLAPPSDEAMLFELEYLKEAGFNMLRKHIKVEPARYYHYADSLGLMVWQDMPEGMLQLEPRYRGRRSSQQVGPRDAKVDLLRTSPAKAQFELELRRMIDALDAFPSVVMWVVHNEGWGQYDTKRLADAVKAYDPTRLVNAVSGWGHVDDEAGEVIDIHTYSRNLFARNQPVEFPDPEDERVFVFGEFGGLGLAVPGHLWFEGDENWGYQSYESREELLSEYEHRLDQVHEAIAAKGAAAAVYTQTTDVEGEVNGLMTYDRDVIKLDPAQLRPLHEALYRAMEE